MTALLRELSSGVGIKKTEEGREEDGKEETKELEAIQRRTSLR